MSNKFLEIVSSPLMNLDHTYRYSGTKLVESESLSQHIVDTIMMGLKVIDEINNIAGIDFLSNEKYLMKAVYHDLEEVITGDIPRPLKYYNNATTNSMREVADNVAHELFESEFKANYAPYFIWKDAKIGYEGYILKLVDNLVVVNKVIKEVTLLHNLYMLKVAHEVFQYTSSLRDDLVNRPCFDNPSALSGYKIAEINNYLVELLNGAIDSLVDILDKHEDVMEDLSISKQSML